MFETWGENPNDKPTVPFDVTASITDKHRQYPSNFVIPIGPIEGEATSVNAQGDRYENLEKLAELRESGVLTEEEFEAEKQKVLNIDN